MQKISYNNVMHLNYPLFKNIKLKIKFLGVSISSEYLEIDFGVAELEIASIAVAGVMLKEVN